MYKAGPEKAWKKYLGDPYEHCYEEQVAMFKNFLREQEARIQREVETAVREKVLKVLDEVIEAYNHRDESYPESIVEIIRARFEKPSEKEEGK